MFAFWGFRRTTRSLRNPGTGHPGLEAMGTRGIECLVPEKFKEKSLFHTETAKGSKVISGKLKGLWKPTRDQGELPGGGGTLLLLL